MTVKHIAERYEVTIILTPEEYEALQKATDWGADSIEGYIKKATLNYVPKGC